MATPPEMAEVLARLWTKFLPEMEQRVALVSEAAQALAAGSLNEEQREAGHAAAHKLAGSLGLFGLARGTEIARRLEHLLETVPADAAGIASGADELRALLAAHR